MDEYPLNRGDLVALAKIVLNELKKIERLFDEAIAKAERKAA